MNSPHRLKLLEDLNQLDLVQESFGYSNMLVSSNNPLGAKAVFKCKEATISEVFGYLLAQFLGAPVANFLGLWFDRETEIHSGYRAPMYHIAILIKLLADPRHISLDELVLQDKSLVTRILTLCFFDRFEWPDILSSNEAVVVMDLERIGPIMCIDEFTSESSELIREQLRYRQDQYANDSKDDFNQLIDKAKQLRVLDETQVELGKLCHATPEVLRQALSVTGHPYSYMLSTFFQAAITRRQAICATELGIRPFPMVDWESAIVRI